MAYALATLATAFGAPAAAQVAGELTLQSTYEVRGYSVSEGRPTGVLDLSYDDPSGVYASSSVFGALPDHYDLGLLGLIGAAGYAKRLNADLSVDGGVTRSEYVGAGTGGYRTGYAELYAGLAVRRLSVHLSYSPDYFHPGVKTLYGDLDGDVGVFAGVRLSAHVGVLDYLERPLALPPTRAQYDWRIGAHRPFGAFDLHAALSGGGPGPDVYDQRTHSKTLFIVGAGYTF